MRGSSNKSYFPLLPSKDGKNKKGFWLSHSHIHTSVSAINVSEDYRNISGGDYVSKQINCHLTGYKFQNTGDTTSIS